MITYSNFINLYEGKKKKERERLIGAFYQGRSNGLEAKVILPQGKPTAPNSPERDEEIRREILDKSGPKLIKKDIKDTYNRAKKTANRIMKRDKKSKN